MKKIFFSFLGLATFFSVEVFGATLDKPVSLTGNAPVPAEIEDPECLGINKEPYHSTLMPYANLAEALKAKRHESSYCMTLNGTWKFNYVAWPQNRPVDFYKTTYDVSSWDDIKVPSNWQLLGYGTPYYRNFGYTIQPDFPHVMSTPPKEYTAYEERNPVGSYRRDFEIPANWDKRETFVTFDGVDAGFFLWINGEKVGYSVNSRNAAEFNITKYIKPGRNTIAVEVYRYTSGTYLEDQDMWRLSGIFRNVTLWSASNLHIRDFYVKTDLDNQYRDATVFVEAKVKNLGVKKSKATDLSVSLYNDEKVVAGAFAEARVPALMPGEETIVRLSYKVSNPEKWTAETPKLYTNVIILNDYKTTPEIMSSRLGFREIEIRGRQFLVNGIPIKLKGANRHENWPEVGHAITEEQMIKDLELLKQGNCNHVRTCHYSDDPRWYELCDEWGIWLVAEANVECHGLDGKFDEEPRIKAAIVDRNVANAENFKNHPSVIIWSLGNECGGRGTNFLAAMDAVRAVDASRPVHYERFGIGAKNPADIDSRMYTSPSDVVRIAQDTSYQKPFYLCEYAHAMFNSMGSIGEYCDAFDKYPTLLGGAIWEWMDQGIYNRRDPKHPILAYGGGFGEYPNNDYFIHKGVINSERGLKPHYPEMKKAYQWIGITAADLAKGTVNIRNKYQYIDLSGFKGSWTISENGTEILRGELTMPSVAPCTDATVSVPCQIANPKPGAEYFLRISFTLAQDELWAKKGFEVASEQFELPVSVSAVESLAKVETLGMKQNTRDIQVNGKDFSLKFDKTTGTMTQMNVNGTNLLANENGGPKLHLWRAPHRNDDMWANGEWNKKGLRNLKWTATLVRAEKLNASTVKVTVNLEGEGLDSFKVSHKAVYTITGDGKVKVQNDVNTNKPDLVIAHMGVRMMLDKNLDAFSYFGRGPMENYSDRKRGFDVGVYSSTVAEQFTPYEKPMECGNHEDIRWASLLNGNGKGLKVSATNSLLQVAALPYSDEDMDNVQYRIDLPERSATVFCVNYRTLGVGSNGCGPRPLEQYRVWAKPTTFEYQINLVK